MRNATWSGQNGHPLLKYDMVELQASDSKSFIVSSACHLPLTDHSKEEGFPLKMMIIRMWWDKGTLKLHHKWRNPKVTSAVMVLCSKLSKSDPWFKHLKANPYIAPPYNISICHSVCHGEKWLVAMRLRYRQLERPYAYERWATRI